VATFKIGKVLLSSVFKKPSTRPYPAVEAKHTDATRGHVEIDQSRCILCGICSKKCPADAISVSKTDRTWIIQRMSCVQCGACVEACPKDCLIMKTDYTPPNVDKIVDTVVIKERAEN